jgi:hypothetical protein
MGVACFHVLILLICGQHRIRLHSVSIPCFPVVARNELQRAVMGTVGGAHDTTWTVREGDGTGHALARVHAGPV